MTIEQAMAGVSEAEIRAQADQMRAVLRDHPPGTVVNSDGKVVMPSGRVVSAARASSLPRARLRLRLLGR